MSIKIEIEAASGADARNQLLALLGQGVLHLQVDNPNVEGAAISEAPQTQESPAPEEKKKRKTKAELEAEKQAATLQPGVVETSQIEPEKSLEPETPAANTDKEDAVTVEMVQQKAIELGRVGKRELCRGVLQTFGAESISAKGSDKPLKPEDYAAVLEAFNAL